MIYIKVKELCAERGVSVSRLERDLGLGNGTVGKWQRQSPRLDNIMKVCKYFKVPITHFVEYDPQKDF